MSMIIEKEARAYVEAYRLEPLPTRRYLVGLLKVIDELHATIRERDAEIARLTTCVGEDALTLCELNSELNKLRAPPGADVMERTKRLIVELNNGEPFREDDTDLLPTARALQQYGDERAREATDQANRVYELHNRLVGHVEMGAESRAEWIMKQSLDGLHIGKNNRGQTKDYLAGHFQQAMVDAQTAAREAAIEEVIAFINNYAIVGDDTRPLVTSLRALTTKPGSESHEV